NAIRPIETTHVHHAARRRGGGVAARGAGADLSVTSDHANRAVPTRRRCGRNGPNGCAETLACARPTVHHREPSRRTWWHRYGARGKGRARRLHAGNDGYVSGPTRQRWLRPGQGFCTGRTHRLHADRGDGPSVIPSEVAHRCNRAGEKGTR